VIDGVRTRIRQSSRFRAGLGGPQRSVCSAPAAAVLQTARK